MGGTTAKLCVIDDGEPLTSTEFEVDRSTASRRAAGLPVKMPVIELIEIGAGGGSIARVDALGLLKVGPDSAGADPGPACYGRGGTEPTVTDADLVLGYLDPDFFLGGRMALDLDGGATRRSQTRVARAAGHERRREAAWGIHQIVNENMAGAARVHAIERGKDPRGLPLFAFGGAGPVHGFGVARVLQRAALIVPFGAGRDLDGRLPGRAAGVRLRAHLRRPARRARLGRASTRCWPRWRPRATRSWLARACARDRSTHRPPGRHALRRARATRSASTCPTGALGPDSVPAIRASVRDGVPRLYGRLGPDVPLEAVSWRVLASGPRPDRRAAPRREATAMPSARKGERLVYFPEWAEHRPTPVYDRYLLAPGRDVRRARRSSRSASRRTIIGPGRQPSIEVDEIAEPACVTAGSDGRIDPIALEVLWNRLLSVTNEQQAALMRTAFTTVVRESQDLACGVFDTRGNMIAQSMTGTPGHINAMATVHAPLHGRLPAGDARARRRADHQRPVDDRRPAQRHHGGHADLPRRAGRRLLRQHLPHAPTSAGASCRPRRARSTKRASASRSRKLFERGERNEELFKIIRANVRTPRRGRGRPVRAWPAATTSAGARCCEFMDEFGLDEHRAAGRRDHRPLRARHARGDPRAARTASTSNEVVSRTASTEPVVLKATVTVDGDEIDGRLRRLVAAEPRTASTWC